jgi:two-component system LytT family sensor kinase
MATIEKNNTEKINRHVIAWTILALFMFYVDGQTVSLKTRIIGTFLVVVNYMFVYYCEYLFVFPKFHRSSLLKLVASLSLTLTIFQIINRFIFFYVLPVLGDKNGFENDPPYFLFLTTCFLFFFISIVAFGATQNEKSKFDIRKQNEHEKALLLKELGFFKNQFNSHITFNFLNYCYSHSLKESVERAEAIELFSQMLQYTLNSKADEPVSLNKEVEQINNFISLQKILENGIQVNFQINGDLRNKYVLPRILMNFVENAFKHGDSKSLESPITIRLETDNHHISLLVHNKKRRKGKLTHSTGVGNYNSIKQLELLYKDNYNYTYASDKHFYSCQISLANKTILK